MITHIFQNKFKTWFGKRMPVADRIELRQRSTYILPSKAGIFLLGVILLMLIGSTNYQNNLAFLLTFLTASIGLVSMILTFKNLQGLVFRLGKIESVFSGDRLIIPVKVSCRFKQAHFTIGCGISKSSLFYVDLAKEEANSFELKVDTTKRGWFSFPRIMTTSSYPFGLFSVWSWFRFSSQILIYPKPIEPPFKGSDANKSEEDGDNKVLGSDDLYGLRCYQSGDPLSRIDWKALARERGLFSKEFVAYQSQNLEFDWDDFSAVEQELRLSYLCYLVEEASKFNYQYSLILPHLKIAVNSGEMHRNSCLEALACYGAEHSADVI